MSNDELRVLLQLERQMSKSLSNANLTESPQDEEVYINNVETLNNIKINMLNEGKQIKGIDKTAIFTSVLGFVSIKQLLAFEATGVITSKVFPSITKWIGK